MPANPRVGNCLPRFGVDGALAIYNIPPYTIMKAKPMAHTIREKTKLIARVRRIRGQVEAVERALASETECTDVLRLIASVRGAVNGLMGEVMEDHILEHVVGAPNANARAKSAEEFAEIVKAYLK
jgi:DNA-binding FrmR family transcriptional regulator